MPELPEVEALAEFLQGRTVGRVIARVDVAAISVLKTYDPSPSSLAGAFGHGRTPLREVPRHGRRRPAPDRPPGAGRLAALAGAASHQPGRAGQEARWPCACTSMTAQGSTSPSRARRRSWPCTSSTTRRRSLASPGSGPDPLAPEFTIEVFSAILDEHARTQLKGLLRDQSVIAGVGNAYSDEILHVARMSPFKLAGTLDADERAALHVAISVHPRGRRDRARWVSAAANLKGEKKTGMRVHGRTGLPCPVCGDTVREVSLRRLLAAVLRDLPDRRQAARRPSDVEAAAVEDSQYSGFTCRSPERCFQGRGCRLVALEVPPLSGRARPVQVVAHRGASAEAPEHTMAAYQRAIDDGRRCARVRRTTDRRRPPGLRARPPDRPDERRPGSGLDTRPGAARRAGLRGLVRRCRPRPAERGPASRADPGAPPRAGG